MPLNLRVPCEASLAKHCSIAKHGMAEALLSLEKAAVAGHLGERFLAPHKWIVHLFCVGAPSSVPCLKDRHRNLIPGMDV